MHADGGNHHFFFIGADGGNHHALGYTDIIEAVIKEAFIITHTLHRHRVYEGREPVMMEHYPNIMHFVSATKKQPKVKLTFNNETLKVT